MNKRVPRNLSSTPICGIYCIKNIINNKVYIGQSIDIERRWVQHKYGKGNLILKNAINKYGLDNFKFEVLESVNIKNKNKDDINKILIKLEQKYFDNVKPFLNKNGYNIQKTSKPNLTPNKSDNFGELISKIKIDNNHCGKAVLQYDLTGGLMKTWKSAAEIERELCYKAECISGVCLKKRPTYKKYIWRFYNNPLTVDEAIKIKALITPKKIKQYNLKGVLLNTYNDSKEAAKLTGLNRTRITISCANNIKTYKNFIWKYENESLILKNHIRSKDMVILQYDLNGTLIKEWNNIIEIIQHLNLSKYASKPIYSVCNNNHKSYLSFIWKWGN